MEEMENCTFSPSITTRKSKNLLNKSPVQRRNTEQLLRDLTQSKSRNRQNLQTEPSQPQLQEQSQLTFQCKKFHSPTNNTLSVFQKLFEDNKLKGQKKIEKIRQEIETQNTFSPKLIAKSVLSQRSNDASQHLYEDAKRRLSKGLDCSTTQEKIQEYTQQVQQSQNKKSKEYLVKIYLKDVEQEYEKCSKLKELKDLKQFMINLKYYQETVGQKQQIQDKLLEKMYKILQKQQEEDKQKQIQEIQLKNIKQFLLNLHNFDAMIISNPKKEKMQLEKQQQPSTSSLVDTSQNKSQSKILNQSNNVGGNWIHQKFGIFHQQKKEYLKEQEKIRNQQKTKANLTPDQQNITFSPQLNKVSLKIADKLQSVFQYSRDRFQQENKTSCSNSHKFSTNFERLYKEAAIISQKHEKERNQMLQQSIKDCTFRPQISSRGSSRQSHSYYSNNSLYQSIQRLKQRIDKSTEQLEYEKQKDECTFKPQIGGIKSEVQKIIIEQKEKKLINNMNKQQDHQKKNSISSLKQKNNNSNRIIKSSRDSLYSRRGKKDEVNQNNNNIQQQVRKSLSSLKQEEKLHYNLQNQSVKNDQDKNELQNEQIKTKKFSEDPLLFANVHIGTGNQIARLILFEGEMPEVVVTNFCLKHNLNDEVKSKLIELITGQLDSI